MAVEVARCVLGCLFLFHLATAYEQLVVSDCSKNANHPLKLVNVDFSPMPISMPGTMRVSFNAKALRDLTSSKISLSIYRETWLMNIPVPCIRNIGSCDYDDSCVVLEQMIEEDWLGISKMMGQQIKKMVEDAGKSTACPLRATDIEVRDFEFRLPHIPKPLLFLAGGDYKVRVIVTENASGEELMCTDLKMSLN
ncbi:ganglioside GM2 activator [Lingula anatina]|uniref:Ganglioside GM2 activator n=1 Tax=Lingula anatina TaxID=7574 RepID=A0A1S3H440_LINAN|nr:ganglioside GM2 activator [Lingula anatina]|eukprot:XP_013380905.1 ganglioside GM2 activator [Lingula anatina]